MKIVFFIPRMGGGGAERVVANLADEFSRRNDEVIIYTPTDNNSFYHLSDSIKLFGENYHISKKKFIRQVTLLINGIRLFFSYKNRMKKWKPDVVISFLTETNIVALLHKKKHKLIISERNDPTKYNKLTQVGIKRLYAKADILVCQSKAVSLYFKEKNTIVIPNPLSSSSLPNPYKGKRKKKVVAIGRLTKQKNFENLITAFTLIADKFGDYILEIYGNGEQRYKLESLIKAKGMSNRIFLMGAHRDVLYKVTDASLFVMSSDYEGYPNALIEAMAIGLPVICTDFQSGIARELIGPENGILVPVNDVVSLTNAMNQLLSDDDICYKMSLNNVEIRDRLSVEKIADMWYDIMNNN